MSSVNQLADGLTFALTLVLFYVVRSLEQYALPIKRWNTVCIWKQERFSHFPLSINCNGCLYENNLGTAPFCCNWSQKRCLHVFEGAPCPFSQALPRQWLSLCHEETPMDVHVHVLASMGGDADKRRSGRSLFRRSQVMADAELRVRSAKLNGFPPFPTWNGTIAAPQEDARGLFSVLGADGELVVLQNSWNDDICVHVVKVLPPAVEKSLSFCQCWTKDGAIVATVHDRSVVVYSSEEFTVLAKLRLQFSAASMDITKRCTANGKEFLLMVGTAFGAILYKIVLDNEKAEIDTAEQTPTPLARVCDNIAVCMVKFSGDGCTAALGSMDGRLFLRRLHSHDDDELASFGASVLSRVLIAPRITSLSFSACSTKLVVATRKGNVYVFYCTADTKEWWTLPSCKDLSANPKPKGVGATGVNKAATAAQTLVVCWGPVFVVCSRAIESRLEVYDFASGRLLHSLQHASAATALNQQQLITGVCCLVGAGLRLLCHDTSAIVTVVEWPFLDMIEER